MFENIPLLYSRGDVTPHTISEKNQDISAEITAGGLLPSSSQVLRTSQFYIDGTIRMLFPYPISDHIRSCYFYPQFFCYMENGSNYFTQRRDYDSFELIYTYEGQGTLRYDGKIYHLKPGDGVWIDCLKLHEYQTDGPGWAHSDLHFNGPACRELFREFSSDGYVMFHESVTGKYQRLLEDVLSQWHRALPCHALCVSNAIGELLSHLLIKKISLKPSEDSANIAALADYIQTHYRDHLTLETMAAKVHMSTSHLSHEFRRIYDVSPINYLIYIRIEHAKQLLLLTDLPIYEVAEQAGFSDQNNFIRHFKKLVGTTPRVFRLESGTTH